MMRRKSIIYIIAISLVIVSLFMFADFLYIKKLYIITFHKNGTISHFNRKGQLNGEVDTYINGKIKSKEFFKDGKRDGPYSMYYENGWIELKSFRKNDKVEGMQYEYYENGTLRLRRNWINNKPYGDFYYYYPNKKVAVYHTYDILGDKFYISRYDQLGKVSRSDGYVFSSRTFTKYNDSIEVILNNKTYKSIRDLYITIADPPQITPKIKIMINNKLRQDIIVLDQNTALIKNAFDQKGVYIVSIEGGFAEKLGFTNHTTGILRIIKE